MCSGLYFLFRFYEATVIIHEMGLQRTNTQRSKYQLETYIVKSTCFIYRKRLKKFLILVSFIA